MLAGIQGWAIYLDFVVVHRPTAKIRLKIVFAALAKHKLSLSAGKCVFSLPAIEFVGFGLTASGITPLQSNVDAIQAIPKPSSATQVASFLVMTAYYLKFLPQYSAGTILLASCYVRISHGCTLRHAVMLCVPSKYNLRHSRCGLI